ncbi:MAG: phage Gp37/Gp68 family protein [Crinalium sp.]
MAITDIEWTRRVWNPTTGCTKVSPGCKNCYAEAIAHRFWGERKFSDVQFHENRLETPLSWKKPTKIFVDSMSDLFHDDVTDEQLDRVFAVMALARHHTFQILTKRPERMMEYSRTAKQRIRMAAVDLGRRLNRDIQVFESCEWDYPLPNVWLGVSVENQRCANERIPLLRHTLAAIKFLSCEPLLEKVSILNLDEKVYESTQKYRSEKIEMIAPTEFINWIIVGGESGSKARPCEVEWVQSLVQECQQALVPVFVKQLGSNSVVCDSASTQSKQKLKSRKGGNFDEFPEDLKIREFPKK